MPNASREYFDKAHEMVRSSPYGSVASLYL